MDNTIKNIEEEFSIKSKNTTELIIHSRLGETVEMETKFFENYSKDVFEDFKTVREYAISKHKETNHTYDGREYKIHLYLVYYFALKFIHLIPLKHRIDVLKAVFCHDIIEDCRETYNDVKKVAGEKVADIVYGVTNEKGKNRDERGNDKYYTEMKLVFGAVYVKICDRLANSFYSYINMSSMFNKYKKENESFKQKLYVVEYQDMFKLMDELFGVFSID